jgi:hypothetical protein
VKSDSDRLLEVLSDGEEHAHTTLYRELNIMVHSRSADLRRRGYDIRVRREGAYYLYRLVGEPSPPQPGESARGVAAAASSPTSTDWRDLLPEPVVAPEQMELV